MYVCKFSWNTDRSFPLLRGFFISLSVCAAIGGPEDSCLCVDDVVLGIADPGG